MFLATVNKTLEDRLVITNTDDFLTWSDLRIEKASAAIAYCCTKYLNEDNDDILNDENSIDLYSLAKKYTTDGIVIYAAMKTPDLYSWEHIARIELTEQFNKMVDCIDKGEYVCINSAGGYMTVSADDITYDNKVELDEKALVDFVKNGLIPTVKEFDEKYFCYRKYGKFYWDSTMLNHDSILWKHGVRAKDSDSMYKLIYYPKKLGHTHNMWHAYGINGLRDSVVYDSADRPFELTNSDLSAIQSFIDTHYEKDNL